MICWFSSLMIRVFLYPVLKRLDPDFKFLEIFEHDIACIHISYCILHFAGCIPVFSSFSLLCRRLLTHLFTAIQLEGIKRE